MAQYLHFTNQRLNGIKPLLGGEGGWRQFAIRDELRIHDLRRTCAEEVWEATHDLRIVQAQLGHRSPTTTARYLANKVSLQDLQPVLERVQQLRASRRQL